MPLTYISIKCFQYSDIESGGLELGLNLEFYEWTEEVGSETHGAKVSSSPEIIRHIHNINYLLHF